MFHISTKSRYGLRALVELSVKAKKHPVSLKEVSLEQKISKKYLENIFRMLQRGGIIRSTRGAKGGYQLARDPEELTVLEVMETIEGPVELLECLKHKNCKKIERCPTRFLWENLENNIKDFLKNRSLQELIDHFIQKKKSFKGMYI
jgi:Rrf2 family cysteine metabolism transcriptional repressor